MAILVDDRDTVARLRQARANSSFLHEHLDELREDPHTRFMVLRDGKLVARGHSDEQARSRARKAGARLADCVVIEVPAEDDTYFF